jgi:GAF domain-containing protein/DNA-binding LacI/PurR family transcriptional regulator
MGEKNQATEKTYGNGSKSRPTIAFLTHSLSDEYGSLQWAGVMDAAREENANLVCFPVWALRRTRRGEEASESRASIIYDLVSKNSVDGLVINSGALTTFVRQNWLREFCKHYRSLPIASIAMALEGIPSVLIDNVEAMRNVVTHLVDEHKLCRFAYIRGPKDNPEERDRYNGFIKKLGEFGLSLDRHLETPYSSEWDEESGVNAVQWLIEKQGLKAGVDFEVVVTGNDNAAFGALRELQRRGIRVPETVKITGFDAQERSKYLTPPLTSVLQPIRKQAYEAAQIVLAQIRHESVPLRKNLSTSLELRQSCGCPHETMIFKSAARKRGAKIADMSSKMALAVSKKTVLSEITQTMTAPSVGNTPEQVRGLLNSFFAALKGRTSQGFLSILEETLNQVVNAEGEVSAWQKAISTLRDNVMLYIDNEQMLLRLEDLCHQARLVIGERTQRALEDRRLLEEQQTALLDEISQNLMTTFYEKRLIKILQDELPRLGISNCYVSLYKNPAVPAEECKLILPSPQPGEEFFPSEQLLPTNLFPRDRYDLIVELLYFHGHHIGLAVFKAATRNAETDKKLRREGKVYEMLRGQLSGALWGARIVGYLRSLQKASIGAKSEPSDVDVVLQDIADGACKAVGARSAWVLLVSSEGQLKRIVTGGKRNLPLTHPKLPGVLDIAAQVMQSNKHELFKNKKLLLKRAGPAFQELIAAGVGAAGCFPMRLRGKSIGVMWVYYEKPHDFSQVEENALQLYVNQAAIAYDNARRMKELEYLHQAAEKLASVAELKDVLDQIVRSAGEAMQADSAAIWSYDSTRKVFLPAVVVAKGTDPKNWEAYKENELRADGTGAIVFQKSYLAVTNIDDAKYKFLGRRGHGLREYLKVKSFQGIALQVDGERLGILYVNYKSPRAFDVEDRSSLEAFAHHAALAMKKARLLDRIRRVHNAGIAVAKASVVGDLQSTLNAVAEGTLNALGCDAVTLYAYDRNVNKLGPQPALAGVFYPQMASRFREVEPDSLVYTVLHRDMPYVVKNVSKNADFKDQRFVKMEGVKSCVALPLHVAGQKVGVMFVNYRAIHRFASEELENIDFFADQAAVAIENARLFEEMNNRALQLETASEAALEQSVKRISERFGFYHTGIFLLETDTDSLPLKAASSEGGQRMLHDEYQLRVGETSIVGYVAATGEARIVPDVRKDAHFFNNPYLPDTRSEMALPLRSQGQLIGVLDVQSIEPNIFTRDITTGLQTLADQLAITINYANRYDNLQQQVKYEATILRRFNPYKAGEPVRGSDFFGRKELIQKILNSVHANNFIIYGERRIGKTSLLFHLEESLRILSNQDDTYYFLPAFASLQMISEQYFFSSLMERIIQSSKIPEDKLKLKFRVVKPIDYDHRDLEHDLGIAIKHLEDQFPAKKIVIVLLLDEMDQFSDYDPQIHGYFRSLFQVQRADSLKMIMAGVSVQRVQQTRTSPWFNLFRQEELRPLDEASARRLIEEPVQGFYQYDQKAVNLILAYSNLIPIEIQRLAHNAISAVLIRVDPIINNIDKEKILLKGIKIQEEDIENAVNAALQEKDGEYHDLWSKLDDQQHQAILDAVKKDGLIKLRTENKPLFMREDLYNITHPVEHQVYLTYLFTQWLKGVRD